MLVNKHILMKHVPYVFEDPTNKYFDHEQKNVIGRITKWKTNYGFVRTFHQTNYGLGGGMTYGYKKNDYYLSKTELSTELKEKLSSRGGCLGLHDTCVVFDTKPAATENKSDLAVNVRLWDDGVEETQNGKEQNSGKHAIAITTSPRKKAKRAS